MKTSELTGPKLREWVARANGWRVEPEALPDCPDLICWEPGDRDVHSFSEYGYCPDLNWAQGGPIIECERITVQASAAGDWRAYMSDGRSIDGTKARGGTPLIAAMRAYVASKFGDSVLDA